MSNPALSPRGPRDRLRAARLRVRIGRSLRGNVEVGAGFSVDHRSTLWAPRRLVVGDDVRIGSDVRIEVDGSIGDGALVASRVGIVGRTDHDRHQVGVPIRRARWVGDDPDRLSRPVRIGADVWLGYGATILSGVRIGDASIVGAGAVVRADVPAGAIVAGNPAVVVGSRFADDDALARHLDALRGIGYRTGTAEPAP